MARIFYSLAGEGRGHATRVRAIVEQLRHEHEIHLFTYGDAFQFLHPIYHGTNVRVRRIPGLRFHYTPNRKVSYPQTGYQAARYLYHLPRLVAALVRIINEEKPDLIITDFEPALPRAAKKAGVPFISLNHQHFLTTYDLSSLPLYLQWHAFYMGRIVELYHSGQRETIVAAFYQPPLKPWVENVTQVGVLLRPEVLAMPRTEKGHIVAYWRRFAGEHVIRAAKAANREVRVYGLGVRPPDGNLTFHAIHEQRFLEDLASCDALISTAGNQLLSEALYLGKPALVMPEASNYEQYINAHFLKDMGAGDWVDLESVTPEYVTNFLGNLDQFRSQIAPEKINGLPRALEAIRRHLPK